MEVMCEANTRLSDIKFKENIEGIDEWPHSFPDGEISYRLNNFSGDLREDWQTKAVTVALRVWQLRLSKLKFRRERNPDTHVDFNVSFENLAHFDGKKGVLAHAYFPGQGDISGDCHINDEWDWVAATKYQKISKPPLVPILIHEFGHSLGLRHDTIDTSSIMYPSFNLGQQKYKLGPRDVTRIQEKYAPRTLPQRIYDRFALRRLNARDFR
jgi:hypothetical protein